MSIDTSRAEALPGVATMGINPRDVRVKGTIPETDMEKPIVAWGLAAAYENTGLGGGVPDAAAAFLRVHENGRVEVRSSSADLGQGLTTVLVQFVAEFPGPAMASVDVRLWDTDLAPDGGPAAASRQT